MIEWLSSTWGVVAAGAAAVGLFLARLILSEIAHAIAGRLFSRPARAIGSVLPTTSTEAQTPRAQTVEDRLRAIDDLLAHGSIDAAHHASLRADVLRDA